MPSGVDHFLLRHWYCIQECLHRGFAEAPAALMWSCLIVFVDPAIEIRLQLVDRTIHLLAEGLADSGGLRALGLSARVIDVLDCKIELVLVPLGVAAILAAAVGQNAQ